MLADLSIKKMMSSGTRRASALVLTHASIPPCPPDPPATTMSPPAPPVPLLDEDELLVALLDVVVSGPLDVAQPTHAAAVTVIAREKKVYRWNVAVRLMDCSLS
jgi:hypothetical protein